VDRRQKKFSTWRFCYKPQSIKTLLSVNHSSGSIPKFPLRGRHCQYTRPMGKRGETETIRLGAEMNLEEIIAKSNIGMRISGEKKPVGRVDPHLGERSSLGTGTTVISMLKTTPEAILYRDESTAPDLIVRTRLGPQWTQGRSASAKRIGLPLFLLTSG